MTSTFEHSEQTKKCSAAEPSATAVHPQVHEGIRHAVDPVAPRRLGFLSSLQKIRHLFEGVSVLHFINAAVNSTVHIKQNKEVEKSHEREVAKELRNVHHGHVESEGCEVQQHEMTNGNQRCVHHVRPLNRVRETKRQHLRCCHHKQKEWCVDLSKGERTHFRVDLPLVPPLQIPSEHGAICTGNQQGRTTRATIDTVRVFGHTQGPCARTAVQYCHNLLATRHDQKARWRSRFQGQEFRRHGIQVPYHNGVTMVPHIHSKRCADARLVDVQVFPVLFVPSGRRRAHATTPPSLARLLPELLPLLAAVTSEFSCRNDALHDGPDTNAPFASNEQERADILIHGCNELILGDLKFRPHISSNISVGCESQQLVSNDQRHELGTL
mmetsp:Transcript_56080/g.149632  ORF Transcript_56080/g.149632 Transcript_56080/m.149632 type:complete len:383 (+) Transcript_56080:1108-2256(+)